MEAFTSGRVSAAARRSYLENHQWMTEQFEPCRGGYRMFAYESQIAMARACGRGARRGAGKATHPFDERKES